MRPKLLIVYSDTGGGHKASAASISAALEQISPGEVEVKAVDVIEDYSLWASNRTYNWFVSMPGLWASIYNSTKATHSLSGDVYLLDPARTLEPYILQGFIRCVQEERPDVIVSVHPILQSAPRATSSHVINGRLVPFVTVVTDLGEAHPWWFNRGVAKLFVPTPDMKAQAVKVGVPEEHVMVCGLPLRKMFWDIDTSAERKQQLREHLGLDTDRPVVLMMGGGDGMGKIRDCALSFFKALAQAFSDTGLFWLLVGLFWLLVGLFCDLLVTNALAQAFSNTTNTSNTSTNTPHTPLSNSFAQTASSPGAPPPPPPPQVVVVCGKNEHLLRVLTAEKRMLEDKAHRLLGIHVLGFVGNIDEWMVTSDLLVTKV